MRPETRRRLLEVFGDPTNVAPSGTGAVLIRPSQLDAEIAKKAIAALPLDYVMRDLGAVAARELADELERRGLKPSDYRNVQELASQVASMISKTVVKSEAFERALREHLGMRGG